VARGRIFRSPLLTFGSIESRGVSCEWTSELRPIGENPVAAGETVELHAVVDASTRVLQESSKVRFDVVTAGAPETRIVSLVGTGATPPEGRTDAQDRTTVFRQLAAGETPQTARAQLVADHPTDFASRLLVVTEGDPPTASHLLTWWPAQRGPEGAGSSLHFRVDVDGDLHAQTEQPLEVGAQALDDRTIHLVLRYEDEKPMAGAEFEVAFAGDQRVRGRTASDGSADVAIPTGVGEVFRLFLLSYPEQIVVPVGPDPDVPPPPPPPRPPPPPPDTRPETVAVFAFDSAFPAPSVFAGLRRVQAKAAAALDARLMVFGHCDKVGTDAYNDALSERRAHAVLALLLDDHEMFDAVAKAEGWDVRVHQSMLRGVGCNPGAIDGDFGSMTRAAVTNFQREYNLGVYHDRTVVLRDRPTLPEDGSLTPATLAAIRDAYVAVAPHVLSEQFADPPFAGCGKRHPISDQDPDNRRATVAFFAADADLASPCDNYEQLVGETLDDRHVPPFSDYEWLQEESGALHLSAATIVGDGTPAKFRVIRCDGPLPVPLPDSSGGGDPPTLGPQLAEVAGEIHGGIAYGRWTSPDSGILDPDTWLVDHDVQLEIVEAADQAAPGDGDPASSTSLLAADSLHPPLFVVEAGGSWGVSPPPGQRLQRLRVDPGDIDPVGVAEGVAVRTDGSLVRFLTDQGLVELARRGGVISLTLTDRQLAPASTGTA
jgi:peptidoglycan hydrolase-like protein with peptidoglycan-binding domain